MTLKSNPNCRHGQTCEWLCYVLPPIKIGDLFVLNTYKANYISKGSGFQEKLIDTMTTNNFYLNYKKTMKMMWLPMIFALFFIPADGRVKSAQQRILTVLPFQLLYFL